MTASLEEHCVQRALRLRLQAQCSGTPLKAVRPVFKALRTALQATQWRSSRQKLEIFGFAIKKVGA